MPPARRRHHHSCASTLTSRNLHPRPVPPEISWTAGLLDVNQPCGSHWPLESAGVEFDWQS